MCHVLTVNGRRSYALLRAYMPENSMAVCIEQHVAK